MLEQNHLAADGDRFVVVVAFGSPVDELTEERVVHDAGGDEVAPPRLPDVDGVEVLEGGGGVGVVIIGGIVGGGDGAGVGVGTAELEGLHFLQDRLDFGELASVGH